MNRASVFGTEDLGLNPSRLTNLHRSRGVTENIEECESSDSGSTPDEITSLLP